MVVDLRPIRIADANGGEGTVIIVLCINVLSAQVL